MIATAALILGLAFSNGAYDTNYAANVPRLVHWSNLERVACEVYHDCRPQGDAAMAYWASVIVKVTRKADGE